MSDIGQTAQRVVCRSPQPEGVVILVTKTEYRERAERSEKEAAAAVNSEIKAELGALPSTG
jgi:hypothetical protein